MAIETSCDETAVAIVAGRHRLIASGVASQISLHQPYGGVVPEVASRNHLTQLKPLIARALQAANIPIEKIDMFAATSGPGLATSLMLGTSVAKGLSLGLRKPYLAVNHLEGHLLSPFFGTGNGVEPCIALIVSGGHTLLVKLDGVGKYEVMGRTRDARPSTRSGNFWGCLIPRDRMSTALQWEGIAPVLIFPAACCIRAILISALAG